MEEVVLLPAYVYNNYNKKLKTLAATKQEIPKSSAEQNPTYQIDSLKKERKTKSRLPKPTFYSTKLCLVRT